MGTETLVLVKLGGSVITDKTTLFSTNWKNLKSLSESLSNFKGKMVIVHGAGSFGHPLAKYYGLNTTYNQINPSGITLTRLAVQTLHSDVVFYLEEAGIHAYSLPPYTFVGPTASFINKTEIFKMINSSGLTPVTFGDVLLHDKGGFVISGDKLMFLLAKKLRPERVVFILDVDGVYDTSPNNGNLLKTLPLNFQIKKRKTKRIDVTGSIMGKIKESQKIANLGIDVFFINGNKPERVLKALKGKDVEGTLIRGRDKTW